MANTHDEDELIPSEQVERESTELTNPAEAARPQQNIQPESSESVAGNFSIGMGGRQEFSGDGTDYDMTCRCWGAHDIFYPHSRLFSF